jgi:MFS transporter, OPA family, sugar phosphate sensor protein UhpC
MQRLTAFVVPVTGVGAAWPARIPSHWRRQRRLGSHRLALSRRQPSRVVASAQSVPNPASDEGLPKGGKDDAFFNVGDKARPEFMAKRRLVFLLMSASYAMYVGLRATWTIVAPVAAESLGLSLNQVGLVTSAFPVMYGMSRLITGVIADRTSASKALGAGLVSAGISNVAMSMLSAPGALAAMWGLNGLVQGVGAGASARLLTSWFSRSERGFWWAVWSSSANLGGFLAPIVCAALSTSRFGFRAGILVPGLFAIALALTVTPLIQDSPQAAGLTAPWARREEREREAERAKDAAAVDGENREGVLANNGNKPTFREALVAHVLTNRKLWQLAFAYFFVYLIRQGTKSWLNFYLIARGCDAAQAAYRLSGMEVGGIVGTFSAGYLSDYFDGRRIAVTVAYLVGLVAAVTATAVTPPGSSAFADIVAIACIGLFINGPQAVVGLAASEISHPSVVATSSGFVCLLSFGLCCRTPILACH